MEQLAYSIKDVTEVTSLSRALIYREMAAGRLPNGKVGRRTIITREQLQAFLASRPGR